jgi:hypothetical protein
MTTQPTLIRGVYTRDSNAMNYWQIRNLVTRDAILVADIVPKLIALGLRWVGDSTPVYDAIVETITELRSGRTTGRVLHAEDIANPEYVQDVFNKVTLKLGRTMGSPNTTSTMTTADSLTTLKKNIAAYRQQKSGSATRDAAVQPATAVSAGAQANSIAAINQRNREYREAKRTRQEI